MDIYIKTYGCTANQDNEAIIRGLLKQHKFTEENKADIFIINTCIVKSATHSKVISKIKEIQKKYPKKQLIITGCLPSAELNLCKKLFPKASLISTHNITKIPEIINKEKQVFVEKRKEIKLLLPKIFKNDVATLQIAEGCLTSCTFCKTKLAKGTLKSFPKENIIKEIKNLSKNYKIIKLTSTDNGCYGLDINSSLPQLLKEIISLKEDFKIRIGMINPEYAKKYLRELIEIYSSPKIIKFIHLPLQSASNKILKDMNRNYTIEDYTKIIKQLRKSIQSINIATDIIVGYPLESLEDFQQTYNFLKENKFEVVNLSKFSPMPGTVAAKLKQLDNKEIKRRSTLIHLLLKN